MKEKDIEAKLKTVVNDWSAQEFNFAPFKTRGELLLKGDTTTETVALMEDSLMVKPTLFYCFVSKFLDTFRRCLVR